MTEHSLPASTREDRLDRLLRDFYAAEMPAALRDGAAAWHGSPSREETTRSVVPRSGHDTTRSVVPHCADDARPVARTLGLTAVVAALMLALSAVLWSGSRTVEPGGAEFQASDAGGRRGASAGEQAAGSFRGAGSRRPVELQSGSPGGVPVGTADGAARGENDFPELDIRIIPIDER